MADRRIGDFATLAEAKDDDLLLVSSENETYNIKIKTLKDAVLGNAERAEAAATAAQAAAQAAADTANAAINAANTAADAANEARQNADNAASAANTAADEANAAANQADYAANRANNAALRAEAVASAVLRYGVNFFAGINDLKMRTFDAAGLSAAVGSNTSAPHNDFDNIYPWSARCRCCGTWNSDGSFVVNAYKGEPGYTEDGSNGEVWLEHSLFYYKHTLKDGIEEIVITATPLAGYSPAPIFVKPDGTVTQKAYTAAYPMATVDGKATSRAGGFPDRYSLNSGISTARTLGSNYTITTVAEWYTECLYMWVEFATQDLQSVMGCATDLPYSNDYKAVTSLPNTNHIMLETDKAMDFVVGQTIGIGNEKGSTSIANNRIITFKEITESKWTMMTFDGEPVNISQGDVVFSLPWINGSCNSVIASSGSPNSDVEQDRQKYNCIYRGKETPFGNAFEWISDVLIKRENSTYTPYFLPDPTKYSNGNITADYVKLNYNLPTSDGFVRALGKDERYPWVRIPTLVGASSVTFYSDYYIFPRNDCCGARVGGSWNDTDSTGPCFWACLNKPADTPIDCGARLSYHRA